MPARKPSPPRNAVDPEQSRRFIDMAREVETEDAPGALDRAFEKVIPVAPSTSPSDQKDRQ